MTKKVVEDGWTPKFYLHKNTIQPDHFARFYGAMLAKKMPNGNRSISQIVYTREIFNNAVPSSQ
jgi:hypothetical protein